MGKLKPTGVRGGSPRGGPKEVKLKRAPKRQYEAAAAIAHAGYDIENDPRLAIEDVKSGLAQNKNPDFRIERVIFDCYTPDPPPIHP